MADAQPMPDAQQALDRLLEGNERFLARKSIWRGKPWEPGVATEPQRPFAVVLGCSDSRTPVEILFDVGFGDLFVIRVAGNIVAPSLVGSVEYAVQQFGTPLVLVMGHTRCGAISATIDALVTGNTPRSRNLRSITDRIAPHIEELVRHAAPEKRWEAAVRANIRASVDHLRNGSVVLERKLSAGELRIVGAEYALETGKVQLIT